MRIQESAKKQFTLVRIDSPGSVGIFMVHFSVRVSVNVERNQNSDASYSREYSIDIKSKYEIVTFYFGVGGGVREMSRHASFDSNACL